MFQMEKLTSKELLKANRDLFVGTKWKKLPDVDVDVESDDSARDPNFVESKNGSEPEDSDEFQSDDGTRSTRQTPKGKGRPR